MINAHTIIVNPLTMNYPYLESIQSFAEFCDKVVVVDGGSTDSSLKEIKKLKNPKIKVLQGRKWTQWYSWEILGINRNIGYEACRGDWAISFDADYVFHERCIPAFKKYLKGAMENPVPPKAVSMQKYNFLTADRYYAKSKIPACVYKRGYPNLRYGLNHKTRSSFMFAIDVKSKKNGIYIGEGIDQQPSMVFSGQAELWVYDYTFMDYNTCERITQRNQLAQEKFEQPSVPKRRRQHLIKGAMNFFQKMMYGRAEGYDIHYVEKLSHHPKYIQEKIKNLKKDMFGKRTFGFTPFQCHY